MPTHLSPASPKVWIDLLLAGAGAVSVWQGFLPLGIPLLLIALVAPVVRLRQGRRGESLLALVPADMATAYRELEAAVALPGVDDGAEAIAAANDTLLETAVLLVGQPARGGSQRRFVDARITAMNATTALCLERHQALTDAMAELDALSPSVPDDVTTTVERRTGPIVRVIALLLMPIFLAWDLVVGVIKTATVLLEGIALRVRATGRIALTVLRHSAVLVSAARSSWHATRSNVAHGFRDARRSTTSLRLRVRLEVRQLRRRVSPRQS